MPGVSSSSFHSSFDAIVRKQQRNMRKYECIKGKIECTDKWITVFHVVHLRFGYRDARVGEYRSIAEVAVVTSNDSKRDETCHKLPNLILLKVTMVNLLY